MNSILENLVSGVRSLIEQRTTKALSHVGQDVGIESLMPGKMLRSRLAGRLLAGGSVTVKLPALQAACAATELVHTASLCHDDVVDNSLIRRSQPALWQRSGQSAAILIGDLLLCEAIGLLAETDGGRYVGPFIAKTRQVVQAEVEQELLQRGKQMDQDTCVRLARDKTGPLFAFVSLVCGGQDDQLASALEEAGYRIGTAYQLADDLLDVVGSEDAAGKTLGTDCMRRKFTLPQAGQEGQLAAQQLIRELCTSAVELLQAHHKMQNALRQFVLEDLQPVLNQHARVPLELAV